MECYSFECTYQAARQSYDYGTIKQTNVRKSKYVQIIIQHIPITLEQLSKTLHASQLFTR